MPVSRQARAHQTAVRPDGTVLECRGAGATGLRGNDDEPGCRQGAPMVEVGCSRGAAGVSQCGARTGGMDCRWPQADDGGTGGEAVAWNAGVAIGSGARVVLDR